VADPVALLGERVVRAIVAAFGAEFANADPAVHRSSFADYQADAALRLTKALKRPPLEVAKAIADKLELDGICEPQGVTVSPPGFVNFRLSQRFLEGEMARLSADERAGVAVTARPETVVIDYSAPNVAKEMHVGHLRSTVIGDSLARTLRFLGHRVIPQNHIGDWGTPFGMLIEHQHDLGAETAAKELALGSLNEFYKAARLKFDTDPAFAERARARVVKLQAGDEATLADWRELVTASRRYFSEIYRRLQIELTDPDVRGESAYNAFLDDVAADLEKKGVARVDDGALCVFLDEWKGRDGSPVPLIVRKSDGGYGYAATDLAAIRYRTRDLGATRLLYVVGAPQQQHFAMVFAAARAAGYLPEGTRAEHVMFGSVLGPDKKMFKSRAGETVRLSELIDEATERAAAAVRGKNPNFSEEEVARTGAEVGIGAIKYVDLSSDRVKDYIFDWDRMLAFEGNTGPYLQYAHARICSIGRKAEADGLVAAAPSAIGLVEAAERALAVELLGFDAAVNAVAVGLQPHKLCTYLYDLASAFTTFFENCPVLKAETREVAASRLALCNATRRSLSLGLGLLGMSAPERM
jgi:arginyl-tRNA synthetase